MQLKPEELAHYNERGFLVLEDFADHSSCDQLRGRAEELVQEFDPAEVVSIFSTREQNRLTDKYFLDSSTNISFFFEENAFLPDGRLRFEKARSINKIGHALHDLDPVFDRFSRSRQLRDVATSIGFENPLLVQSMYIFKQPNIGGEVTCHQDSTFIYTEPPEIAGLWFALEDATVENGCLWAIPGGHRSGLKSRWLRSRDASGGRMEFQYFNRDPWPEEKLIPLEVRKGSLILLHGLLPHRSLENRSARSRHAYTLHLIPKEASYAADNWLQRPATMPFRSFE